MNFWNLPRSLRSATSSALTGPLPSAALMSVSLPTFTFTTAVVSTSQPLAVLRALLDLHVEIGHVEELRHRAEHAPRQQLERSIRRLVGIADRLALLDLVEQAARRADRPWSTLSPMRSSSASTLERPAWSETSSLRLLPTVSGVTCS